MNAQDLRKLLEQTDDKSSIFASPETLNKYEFNAKEFFDLISDFLSDEEKLKLFDYSHFRQFEGWIKGGIIGLISDEHIILQIINNDNIMNGFESYQIVDIIKKMSDIGKQQLLYNQEFIEKHQIAGYEIEEIISSLTEETRVEILMDIDLIRNKLHLEDFQVTKFVERLSSEEVKDKAIGIYQFANYQKKGILRTYSNSHKLDVMMQEKGFNKFDIIDILQTLDVEALSEFLTEHKEFCNENQILPYEVVKSLDGDQQMEFVAKLEDINLTLNEKREILAVLNTEVKHKNMVEELF